MKPIQPTPTKRTETLINEEMQRLDKLSPLLSPTVGWPKLKGLQNVFTRLRVSHVCKTAIALPEYTTRWCLEDNPHLREEAKKAVSGILGSVVDLATAALKSTGWKLKIIDQKNSHHVAMLWTRKGQQVALLGYIPNAAPTVSWVNTAEKGFKRSDFKGPNAHNGGVMLAMATPKGGDNSLRDVCAALDKQLVARVMNRKKGLILEDESRYYGMPQVHICRMGENNSIAMSPQHVKLVESLRGKVCFVGFRHQYRGYIPKMPSRILCALGGFNPGAAEAWIEMSGKLQAGQIRLVAVDDQNRMKWCETFGPEEKVPEATIKRLLASSHYDYSTELIEQEAVYNSIKQAE